MQDTMKKTMKWQQAGALALACCACALVMTEPAYAAGGGIEKVMQNIVDLLTGNTARLLAIIAVIIVGIGWSFGRVDMNKAGAVVVGIAVVFGAAEIVDMMMK